MRDVGGATGGLVRAVDEDLFPAPRLVIAGKALSQTGGHCDFRGPYDYRPSLSHGLPLGALGRVCDGVAELRRAAREEIKGGAKFIKIMANGGCASPTDPIHFLGFAEEEVRAAVEEARMAGTYVSAHLYTDESIRRSLECGVHSLEHCNLIEPATAALAAAKGAVAVPTQVTYERLAAEGASLGFPAESIRKVEVVRSAGCGRWSCCGRRGSHGIRHRFAGGHASPSIRGVRHSRRVLPAREVIASATHVAARLCRMEGEIGAVAPGAYADLVVVDGDPLADLSLLTRQGAHLPVIMKGGIFAKRCSLAR